MGRLVRCDTLGQVCMADLHVAGKQGHDDGDAVEEPILRVRLSTAAPSVRKLGGRVPNASTCSGTKVRPMPRPWMRPDMTIGVEPISIDQPVIRNSELAEMIKPDATMMRASI